MPRYKCIDIFEVIKTYYLEASSKEEAKRLALDYFDGYEETSEEEYAGSEVLEEVDEKGDPLLSASSSPLGEDEDELDTFSVSS